MRIRSTVFLVAATGVTCGSLPHGVPPAPSVIGLTLLTLYLSFSFFATGGCADREVVRRSSARVTLGAGRATRVTIRATVTRMTVSPSRRF